MPSTFEYSSARVYFHCWLEIAAQPVFAAVAHAFLSPRWWCSSSSWLGIASRSFCCGACSRSGSKCSLVKPYQLGKLWIACFLSSWRTDTFHLDSIAYRWQRNPKVNRTLFDLFQSRIFQPCFDTQLIGLARIVSNLHLGTFQSLESTYTATRQQDKDQSVQRQSSVSPSSLESFLCMLQPDRRRYDECERFLGLSGW